MTGSVVGGWLLGQLWKEWQPLTGWLTLAALLPSIWFLIVRCWTGSPQGSDIQMVILRCRYSKRFYLHTVVIPGASVVGVTFRQSLFQAFRGNCDLLLDTHSQGRRRHRVRNLRLEEAKALFRQAGIFS